MLYKSLPQFESDVELVSYESKPEFKSSDHKPIVGTFKVTNVGRKVGALCRAVPCGAALCCAVPWCAVMWGFTGVSLDGCAVLGAAYGVATHPPFSFAVCCVCRHV